MEEERQESCQEEEVNGLEEEAGIAVDYDEQER
jgi:hypothetical protein